MIQPFLHRAAQDRPVYLSDVRAVFQAEGTRPFHVHITGYDAGVRVFPLLLPQPQGEDQTRFLNEYVWANLYNMLSALGAVQAEVFLDPSDRELRTLAEHLTAVFQTDAPKEARTGYGRCLNVNERVLSALFGKEKRFAFRVRDIREEPAPPEVPASKPPRPVFGQLPERILEKFLLGIDVGGTVIKLAVSVDGRLALCKEFDWNPAACTRAEELTGPIVLLTRLMRAAGSLCRAGRTQALDWTALDRGAGLAQLERGALAMERAAGRELQSFDAIGLSFPDVVIHNRIVGGETPKTQGLRGAPDYEREFAKVTALHEALSAYTVPGGPVRTANDGPMAAFTAAVEQAAGGVELSKGFFAHTLGTDLGTGWVRPDGSIPDIPLEVYNVIIDLGSWGQRQFPPEDARSILGCNTRLPGTLQRCANQSGVFRLAANRLPREDPDLFQKARDLFQWEGDVLRVPEDRRKSCLAFFLEQAERSPAVAELFCEIGEYLAEAWKETQFLLAPEAEERTLFGRLVMSQACFQLMCQGAARRAPELRLLAADGDLANTGLMRQLDAMSGCTVAQFAQAVGAIYYSVTQT